MLVSVIGVLLSFMGSDYEVKADDDTFTITYHANGGEFENGSDTNVVTYKKVYEPDYQYLHSMNIDDDGTRNGNK